MHAVRTAKTLAAAAAALAVCASPASALEPFMPSNPLPVGKNPTALTRTSNGDLWVVNKGDNTVKQFSADPAPLRTIAGFSGPDGIARDVVPPPATELLYVINNSNATLSRFDTAASTPGLTTIGVGKGPKGIAVGPKYVYTANSASHTVSVVGKAPFRVVKTISLGAGRSPYDVALTPDLKYLLVANYGKDSITVINTSSNTVKKTIALAVGSGPYSIAVDPKKTPSSWSRAYVSLRKSGKVAVINLNTLALNSPTRYINIGAGSKPGRLAGCAMGSPVSTYFTTANSYFQWILVPREGTATGARGGGVSVINTAGLSVTQDIKTDEPISAISRDNSGEANNVVPARCANEALQPGLWGVGGGFSSAPDVGLLTGFYYDY